MLRSKANGGRSHPVYRGILALPAAILELPAPAAIDPAVRCPVIATAFAHPVAVMPHVAAAAPIPIAGGPDIASSGLGNDFDSRRRRRNLDDDRSRFADDRYRDRPHGQRPHKDSSVPR